MDRTAAIPDWMVIKPFLTQASNCIFPGYVVAALVLNWRTYWSYGCSAYAGHRPGICRRAY